LHSQGMTAATHRVDLLAQFGRAVKVLL
jgi:hypothetical protein